MRDAEAQRVDPRRFDKRAQPVQLEVDRVREIAGVVEPEIPDKPEWRLRGKRALRHLQQEARRRLGQGQQPGSQSIGQRGVAEDRAEIEEDRRMKDGHRVGVANPRGELLLPLRERQAPAPVARHDVTLAQWKAAAIQRLVDGGGKWQQAFARFLRRHAGRQAEDQAVVLIGGEGLLEPTFAAERDPAKAKITEPMSRQLDLEYTLRQAVVQRRDELRQLLGANAVGQHVLRQLANVLRGMPERRLVLCRGDRLR